MPAYWPWRRALAGLSARLRFGAGAGEPDERPVLLAAVVETLEDAGRKQPLLIAIDDLHWADRSSLLLLRTVIEAAPTLALAVMLTARDDALTADVATRAAIADLPTAVRRVPMPPLDRGRGCPLPPCGWPPPRARPGTHRIVWEVADVAVVRVLLVDDQAAFLRAMIGVVQETPGFEVVGAAASGEESVGLAGALLPDLVLMDVNLPGIDGLEATRRLREDANYSPVVFLLSTHDEDVGDRFTAESGTAAYMTKSSFGPDHLQDRWSTVVR